MALKFDEVKPNTELFDAAKRIAMLMRNAVPITEFFKGKKQDVKAAKDYFSDAHGAGNIFATQITDPALIKDIKQNDKIAISTIINTAWGDSLGLYDPANVAVAISSDKNFFAIYTARDFKVSLTQFPSRQVVDAIESLRSELFGLSKQTPPPKKLWYRDYSSSKKEDTVVSGYFFTPPETPRGVALQSIVLSLTQAAGLQNQVREINATNSKDPEATGKNNRKLIFVSDGAYDEIQKRATARLNKVWEVN